MNRRDVLKVMAYGATAGAFELFTHTCTAAKPPAVSTAEAQPNIILIFVDDVGYGDLSCYGAREVYTPYLDLLARYGVRFTDGYVTAPVCAPSRCGLMAGAYQQRFGMFSNPDKNRYVLPVSQKTIPEALKAAGYVTGHIGKWNINRNPKFIFDEVWDLMDFWGEYWPDENGNYGGVNSGNASKTYGLWGPHQPDDEYLTDRIGRHACEFIDRHSEDPFFLYLAFNTTHGPWQGNKRYLDRVSYIQSEPLRIYATMLLALDDNIGRVMHKLKERGLEHNTLVVFVSDNGPSQGINWKEGWDAEKGIRPGSAGPLNGRKAHLLEGGIRVPFILRWPAKFQADFKNTDRVYTRPVMTTDLYPTLCAAGGASIPQGTVMDGVNLLPYLNGEKKGSPHDMLCWSNGSKGAIRRGDWKLVIGEDEEQLQLFNLRDDLGETHNLASEKQELVQQLLEHWNNWGSGFPPPARTAKK